jgi:hypothetical protein
VKRYVELERRRGEDVDGSRIISSRRTLRNSLIRLRTSSMVSSRLSRESEPIFVFLPCYFSIESEVGMLSSRDGPRWRAGWGSEGKLADLRDSVLRIPRHQVEFESIRRDSEEFAVLGHCVRGYWKRHLSCLVEELHAMG